MTTTETCPRPDKRCYFTRRAAKESLRRSQLKKNLCAYLCRCGWWHLGNKPR